jgi:hypothetical protein
MHITITRNTFIRGVLGALFLGGIIWFGIEPGMTLWRIYAPFPKPWQEFHLTSGEIWYARQIGSTGSVFRLRDVYTLERFTQDQRSASSGEFSLEGSPKEKYVLVKKTDTALLSRASILYQYDLAPDSEVARYLNPQ